MTACITFTASIGVIYSPDKDIYILRLANLQSSTRNSEAIIQHNACSLHYLSITSL